MERLRSLDRRAWLAILLLVSMLWWGPDLIWPYRHVVNLGAPGDVVAVLGDSIPAGFGDGIGAEHAWPTLVAKRLGLQLVNKSVAGATTERGLSLLDEVLSQHPRLVIVELGGNDMMQHTEPEKMAGNLDLIFDRIHKSGAMVLYASVPTPLNGKYASAWAASSRAHGVWHVKNILSGVFGTPTLMYDAIHPNARGHEVIAERMTAEISSLLRAGDSRRGR